MPSADRARRTALAAARSAALAAALALGLTGCGGTFDDLFPSSADHSGGAAGTTGPAVGQTAPDFTLPITKGGTATLAGVLSTHRAAVLYFVMWCPICDGHMGHMFDVDIPAFPDVAFLALDYVSGSVDQALQSQVDAGWGGDAFLVLADVGAVVERYYSRPMGVVVIDRDGVVRMNEEFDGARLHALLGSLP